MSVSVESAVLDSVEITAPGLGADQSLQLTAGEQIQFSATGNFSNNESRDITDRVTWTSDDPALAIANDFPDHGLASALAAGEANVQVILDETAYGNVKVTVIADPLAPESVSLSVTGDDAVRWNAGNPPAIDLQSLVRNGNGDDLTIDADTTVTFTVISGPLTFAGNEPSVVMSTSAGRASANATATGPGTARISVRVEGTSLAAQTRVYIVNDFSEVIVPSRTSTIVMEDGVERPRIRFSLLNLSKVDIPISELRIRVPGEGLRVLSPSGVPNLLPFDLVPGRGVVGQGIVFNPGATGVEATYRLRTPGEVAEEFDIEL